ncbi:MAG: hypothetical protein J6M60_00500 [Clostridia bacterium]|nr:hypothetical protein [Clostridia bacterium]
MKIRKVLKIVGIILLVVIILLLIHTIRNFIIVRKLQNNITQYANSTNYSIKSIISNPNKTEIAELTTTMFYKKDNKQAGFVIRGKGQEITKISMFGLSDQEGYRTYIENGESKIAKIETEGGFIMPTIVNGLESDSTWHTFISCFFAYIRSTVVNSKDCYIVSNYPSYISLNPVGKNEYYIEKDTGLMIENITNDMISGRDYEFDNVDDSIFVEPDISEYIVQ